MRKIEQQMVNAINRRVDFSSANTSVVKIDDVNSAIYLHGNHIADVNSRTGFVMVNTDTLRRWSTPTTKSRLRALGANVSTRKGVTYLNDVAI
jgi:membrane protease subunit (stomatin/prohibitin family)